MTRRKQHLRSGSRNLSVSDLHHEPPKVKCDNFIKQFRVMNMYDEEVAGSNQLRATIRLLWMTWGPIRDMAEHYVKALSAAKRYVRDVY
ncbi:hypothetical protein ACC761_14740 [Rhizobium ruizarguesonis]